MNFDLSCLGEFRTNAHDPNRVIPPSQLASSAIWMRDDEITEILGMLFARRTLTFDSENYNAALYTDNPWVIEEWLARTGTPHVKHRLAGHLTIQLTEPAP